MKRAKMSKIQRVTRGNVTVKIYRRERPYYDGKRILWQVSDYSNGSRRLREFADHGHAMAEAERIARGLATGEAIAAGIRNSEAASYGRAMELLRPSGASLEIACATYAKAFDLLGGDAMIEAARFYSARRPDKITRRTVAEVLAELLAAKEARGKSDRYLADLRIRLGRFANDWPVDIGSIAGPDIQGWLDRLKMAPRSVANFRTCLGTLFGFAESRGYVFEGGNPIAKVESIEITGDGVIEIYTPEELAKLLNNAPVAFVPFIAIGAFAGLRTAETERLAWQDVDLSGGFIEVKAAKAKTRSRCLVPITTNLVQWVRPYARPKGNVFEGNVSNARVETAKAAGIRWKHNGLFPAFERNPERHFKFGPSGKSKNCGVARPGFSAITESL